MKNKTNKGMKSPPEVKASEHTKTTSQAQEVLESYTQRNVGIQTVQETKFYVSPQMLSHHELEKYDYNWLFYSPKTVSTMVFTLLMLNFFAYTIVPLQQKSTGPEDLDSAGFTYTQKL